MIDPSRLRQAMSGMLLALGTGLACSPAAWAASAEDLADLSLSSLLDMPVTGASRFAQRRSQAASAVTVVTREEIQAFGHRTLGDVLRGVRGVFVSSDRTYEYLGVRGLLANGDYNTRVLLLVDGNRVNDMLYDQAVIGNEFPLDLENVERVEFIPGQGSAVYGANALFGVINVITQEAPRQRQAAVRAIAGAAGERQLSARLRLPFSGGGLQLQASHHRQTGDTLFDPQQVGVNGSDGFTRGTDTLDRRALSLRADLGGWTASLTHATRTKGTPITLDLVYGDPRNRYRDTTSLLNLERSLPLGTDSRLVTRAYVGRYRFEGDYVMDYPPVTVNRDDAQARWHGVELRGYHTGWQGHRVVAGVELQNVTRLAQWNGDTEPTPAVYLDDARSDWRASLYAEDQWAMAEGWDLHLGARADRSSQRGWHISPRAALVWTPKDSWAVKLIQGSAFRPPNAYEAYYEVDAAAGYRRNPGLGSERVSGSELVLEWRPRPGWRLSGSWFESRAKQLLVLGYDTATDRYVFSNAGDLTARGGELELEVATSTARWRASASEVSRSGSGAATSLHPDHQLKASVLWHLRADWTLALEAQAVSRRGTAPGYAVGHATLQGPLWPGAAQTVQAANWMLQVRNLADAAIVDPGFDAARQPTIPMSGRQWRVGLSWPLTW